MIWEYAQPSSSKQKKVQERTYKAYAGKRDALGITTISRGRHSSNKVRGERGRPSRTPVVKKECESTQCKRLDSYCWSFAETAGRCAEARLGKESCLPMTQTKPFCSWVMYPVFAVAKTSLEPSNLA